MCSSVVCFIYCFVVDLEIRVFGCRIVSVLCYKRLLLRTVHLCNLMLKNFVISLAYRDSTLHTSSVHVLNSQFNHNSIAIDTTE